jgi:hypothetical protein
MTRTIFILAILAQRREWQRGLVFRSANLNQYAPVDPCRQYSIDSNTAGASGNASGLLAAISAMSTPIRSFRPLAAF